MTRCLLTLPKRHEISVGFLSTKLRSRFHLSGGAGAAVLPTRENSNSWIGPLSHPLYSLTTLSPNSQAERFMVGQKLWESFVRISTSHCLFQRTQLRFCVFLPIHYRSTTKDNERHAISFWRLTLFPTLCSPHFLPTSPAHGSLGMLPPRQPLLIFLHLAPYLISALAFVSGVIHPSKSERGFCLTVVRSLSATHQRCHLVL